MKTHTEPRRFAPRPLAFTLAALVLALCIGAVACTDFVDTGSTPAATDQASTATALEDALTEVDEAPQPVGGMEGLTKALQDELKYPEIARKAGVEGRVLVQFVVDKEGNVVAPTVLKGIGAGCDEEAVRAVSTLKFTPGRQNGQAVPVKFTMPIVFALPDEAPTGSAGLIAPPTGSDLHRLIRPVDAVIATATRPDVC